MQSELKVLGPSDKYDHWVQIGHIVNGRPVMLFEVHEREAQRFDGIDPELIKRLNQLEEESESAADDFLKQIGL